MNSIDILNLLEQHGVMPTAQRLEIANILLSRPQHLSADQIIDSLKQQDSRVSKATVYNTLNLFGERGIVREIMVDPVRKYYDSTTHDHHHFYNVDTGELLDIPTGAVELADLPALPEGTVGDGIDIVIRVKNRE
ncbi:MAG: Fur family transcriptional regulator [Pseudomonadota bacterium]